MHHALKAAIGPPVVAVLFLKGEEVNDNELGKHFIPDLFPVLEDLVLGCIVFDEVVLFDIWLAKRSALTSPR